MKTYLTICFFFILTVSFSQNERKVISYIDSINSLASNHYKSNDITQSFNYLLKNVELSASIDDDYGNAQANFLLGNLYRYMGMPDEAAECYSKMLKSAKEVEDNYLIASSYLSLGEIYKLIKPMEAVIPYYKKALTYASKNNVRDENNIDKRQNILFDIHMKLSHIYMSVYQPNEAYMNLLAAEKNLDNNWFSKASLSYAYGLYYVNLKSFNLATRKFSDALGYLENSKIDVEDLRKCILLKEIYKEQSVALASLGKVDDAYLALLNHDNYREKLLKAEKLKEEQNANSKFFMLQYKNIAQTANKELWLVQNKSNEIKSVVVFVSVAAFVLLILIFILVKNYRSKRRLSFILQERNRLLQIAKNEAEKSSKLKTDFISNVTHELRTPLYGVVGLTSLMLEKNSLNEEDQKLLKSLKYSGDYLLNLVNDILQMGKMESEKVELKNVSVNLREMVASIIGSFEYRLQESNNEIHVLIDDSVPEVIMCDNVRLSQVLINLIGNSIKFTNNGKIWLRVILNNLRTNDADIRFEIEDNGSGIPKNMHKTIFQNFTQLDENKNANYQGTGLGLSIVKKIVELFNSKIELSSDLGKGSIFSFNVTFQIDNNVFKDTKPSEKGKIVTLNQGYKILIAEDNKINQIVTKNLLKKENFICDVVENGLECVKAFKSNSYDLILMDINMPVMDGNQATQEIRKENSDIPIIALTAADIEEVKKNFGTIGYNGIITKPFDNCEFFQVINAHIQASIAKSKRISTMVKVS